MNLAGTEATSCTTKLYGKVQATLPSLAMPADELFAEFRAFCVEKHIENRRRAIVACLYGSSEPL